MLLYEHCLGRGQHANLVVELRQAGLHGRMQLVERKKLLAPVPEIPSMPIYEFYCPGCYTVFTFFSRKINTTTRPSMRMILYESTIHEHHPS